VDHPACAFTLRLGKAHWRYSPSAYRLCVTSTQAKKLFGSTEKPKLLGCGTFACAYAHATKPGKVVKLTRDESDVAALIRSQGKGIAPRLYDTHKLTTRGRWLAPHKKPGPPTRIGTEYVRPAWPAQPEPVYGMVLERLTTFTPQEIARWNRRFKKMATFVTSIEADEQATTVLDPKRPARRPVAVPGVARLMQICEDVRGHKAKACALRIKELDRLRTKLRTAGVHWTDIHAGNIGIDKRGRWKALDLGVSHTALDTAVPELAGRKRGRRT
jgi:hypothetical protein